MSSTVSAPVFDKKKHVLLIPDLFPIHMELLANVIRASGYRVEVLRTHGADVMEAGLKYIHNDMCYPAICSLGQQLHAITSGTHDPADVAFVQFQTGGGCRASNYSMVLRKALNKLGLEIPIVTLGFSTLSRNSGFSLTPAMCIRALVAVTYGDLLLLLGNQVRPYETNPGQTQSLLRHWEETLGRELSAARAGLGQVKRNLKNIARSFAEIPVKAAKKVKVGIVGEVYVKYSPFANNQLEEFLQNQDCEYMLPGVLGFLRYCLSSPAVDWELYGGSRFSREVSVFLGRVIGRFEAALSRALAGYPQFHTPPSFRQMREKGERILSKGVKMGEGWYLPAEMVELIESGYDRIICAQPHRGPGHPEAVPGALPPGPHPAPGLRRQPLPGQPGEPDQAPAHRRPGEDDPDRPRPGPHLRRAGAGQFLLRPTSFPRSLRPWAEGGVFSFPGRPCNHSATFAWHTIPKGRFPQERMGLHA